MEIVIVFSFVILFLLIVGVSLIAFIWNVVTNNNKLDNQ